MKNCFKLACHECGNPDHEECEKMQAIIMDKMSTEYEPIESFLKEMSRNDSF